MTWVDPPDFTVGQVLTAAELDTISGDLNFVKAAPRITGLASLLVGSLPAVLDDGFKIQAGTVVVMTDASANGTVTFPSAFSTGVLTVVVGNGDTTTDFCPQLGAVTLSQFAFHGAGTSGAADAISVSVRVNYIAIGA